MSVQLNNKQINISSIILAGGKGTRLFPLTLFHSKPAICFGGRYRLIDIPISNSLNSNIRNIYVLGQYLTTELQHHLSHTYQFDNFFPGSLDVLTPEELPSGEKVWYNGTADAIRKNLTKIYKAPFDYFLILSGDQLYNINFYDMLSFAIKKNADLTIATLPVCEAEAKRMGILKIDKDNLITDFIEKPQDKKILSQYKVKTNIKKKPYLGSMGIYIFKRRVLSKLLSEKGDDFGKDLIPIQIKKGITAAFLYDGYWEDIGTVESFYNANIALTEKFSGLKTYDEKNPIYTRTNHLPGTKIKNTILSNSIICEGSIIEAKSVTNSIVGLRSVIKKGTVIAESILLGNNYYHRPKNQNLPSKFEIGKNCLIKKAIIDEHVFIGNNVKLVNKDKKDFYNSKKVHVRDGIIILNRGVFIPDNFTF
ncbi:MAG: glucose-1-phosphate adenylyltransferase [Chlamydiae bacterium SM23_39]|nr:MAG: glucose-1-phosphate adenylyltransferase [Chlamydiae bacterium SM23_39]